MDQLLVLVLVVVESPFAGEVERNLTYVRRCMADCFAHGKYPYASHALYTQPGVLDDTKPEERKLGMEAGFAWAELVETRIFYLDYGVSSGMRAGFKRAVKLGQHVILRWIGQNGEAPPAVEPAWAPFVEELGK